MKRSVPDLHPAFQRHHFSLDAAQIVSGPVRMSDIHEGGEPPFSILSEFGRRDWQESQQGNEDAPGSEI